MAKTRNHRILPSEQETRIAVMAPLLLGDRKLVVMAALGHSINFQCITIGLAAMGHVENENENENENE